MIRWKVVYSKSRASCVLIRNDKYRKIYKNGEIVKALRGTLGIFCFKTKTDAIDFMITEKTSIIKVKPIGRGEKPKRISSFFSQDMLDRFYTSNLENTDTQKPPEGTICYPAVKVLE